MDFEWLVVALKSFDLSNLIFEVWVWFMAIINKGKCGDLMPLSGVSIFSISMKSMLLLPPTSLSLFRNNKNDILWCITIYFVGKTSFDSSLASHWWCFLTWVYLSIIGTVFLRGQMLCVFMSKNLVFEKKSELPDSQSQSHLGFCFGGWMDRVSACYVYNCCISWCGY